MPHKALRLQFYEVDLELLVAAMISEIMSGCKETDSRNRPNPTFWFGDVSPGMSEYTDSP